MSFKPILNDKSFVTPLYEFKAVSFKNTLLSYEKFEKCLVSFKNNASDYMYFKLLKSLLEVFYSTPPSSIINSIQEQMIDILYFIMHSDINLSIQNYYKLLNIIDMYAPVYDLSKITLFLSGVNIFYNIQQQDRFTVYSEYNINTLKLKAEIFSSSLKNKPSKEILHSLGLIHNRIAFLMSITEYKKEPVNYKKILSERQKANFYFSKLKDSNKPLIIIHTEILKNIGYLTGKAIKKSNTTEIFNTSLQLSKQATALQDRINKEFYSLFNNL